MAKRQVKKVTRDTRRYEYPDPTPVATPVTFRGKSVPHQDMARFMQEWSRAKAEAEHVETFEEANDFEIYDPEDNDFFHDLTPYEMLDMPEIEEADQGRLEQNQPADPQSAAESNETEPAGAQQKVLKETAHDKSAPMGDSPPD